MRHLTTIVMSLLLLACAAYLSWPVTADVPASPPAARTPAVAGPLRLPVEDALAPAYESSPSPLNAI